MAVTLSLLIAVSLEVLLYSNPNTKEVISYLFNIPAFFIGSFILAYLPCFLICGIIEVLYRHFWMNSIPQEWQLKGGSNGFPTSGASR
jgi:hypothetical protein